MTKPSTPPPGPEFNTRLACGLLGILIAAMVAGLCGRVPSLVEEDIIGFIGVSTDQYSWVETAFNAGELIAMPFSTWLAITFSLRRFHLLALLGLLLISVVVPFIHDINLLIITRFIHGYLAGTLIPLLMMSALRFLPAPIRLHGLALYAMTATLAPNLAFWLSGIFTQDIDSYNWIYWHLIPLGVIAALLVWWGIPKMPLALPRLKQANLLGVFYVIPGFIGITVTLSQGGRLEWFHSSIIQSSTIIGVVFTVLFLTSEWRHPAPFMKLQMLGRRNLAFGFTVFFFLLFTMGSGATLPVTTIMHLQNFSLEQVDTLGLIIALPQLFMGSIVALLLYQKWVDARFLLLAGLVLIAYACWEGSYINDEWMVSQFLIAQICQSIGQPMAVVSMLFLGTSVVQPMEGPYVAGIINTLRVLGTLCSGAFSGQFLFVRSSFHYLMLNNGVGQFANSLNIDMSGVLQLESSVMASSDLYFVFGALAVLLIPLVLLMQHIPAPQVRKA